jgi:hypothetical protein
VVLECVGTILLNPASTPTSRSRGPPCLPRSSNPCAFGKCSRSTTSPDLFSPLASRGCYSASQNEKENAFNSATTSISISFLHDKRLAEFCISRCSSVTLRMMMAGRSRRGVGLLSKLPVAASGSPSVAGSGSALSQPRGWCTRSAFPLHRYRWTPRANYSSSRPASATHSTWSRNILLLLAGAAAASVGYVYGVNDAGNNSSQLLERKPKAPTYATKGELEQVDGNMIRGKYSPL